MVRVFGVRSSVVEHYVDIVGVGSSTLLAPTKNCGKPRFILAITTKKLENQLEY